MPYLTAVCTFFHFIITIKTYRLKSHSYEILLSISKSVRTELYRVQIRFSWYAFQVQYERFFTSVSTLLSYIVHLIRSSLRTLFSFIWYASHILRVRFFGSPCTQFINICTSKPFNSLCFPKFLGFKSKT